jgi:hypothetical protein
MNIYHYHPQTGVLLGEDVADESPLEPGVWLIPAHATTITPPNAANDQQVVFIGDGWQLQSIPEPEPSPEPPPAPAPRPDYLAFWDALIASGVYSSIRTQSMVSLPMNTLVTEFIALIIDAKMGRGNQAMIQSSISGILGVGSFTEEELGEFEMALVAGNLEDVYLLS